MNPILRIALALVLFAPIVHPQDLQVIETGTFHGDEIAAKDGEFWLGLYDIEGTYMLLPSILAVKNVFDAVIDSAGEATGVNVSAPGMGKPRFLVSGKGFNSARPAPAVKGLSGHLTSPEGLRFDFRGDAYRLIVEPASNGDEKIVNGKASLYFLTGKIRQLLYRVDECDSCIWRLNWAGDLDSDGKPDLYVLVTHHYNVAYQKLFLSSRAENGKLVREVAEFSTTGC